MKMTDGDPGKDFNKKPNLSSTLEELYVWEKKLYKEVKAEERLRVDYEKESRRLKLLDERGAETEKIDAAQASIRKLLTKIDVCIRGIEAISKRIHKLRDEELKPQLSELINGFAKMWKSMLKCHQKQFHAIMDSKTRNLRVNTGFKRDSSLQITLELEMELLKWCTRFHEWIVTQKSYVQSLHRWLMRCLDYKPEQTLDGPAPFSPNRIGAPSIFVIGHDWYQAMARISEAEVANAMHDFATKLHELSEKQDEEMGHRLKTEYLTNDFDKRLRTLRREISRLEQNRNRDRDRDTLSDKNAASIMPSERDSGISPLDDLRVDLDSMRRRLDEERLKHKESVKLVHTAASSSLQCGLVPIFESLQKFTSDAVRAHEQVRIQNHR